MTGKLAWALRRENKTIIDFSIVPEQNLALDFELAVEPHFFYGSTGMLKRLRQVPAWATGLFGAEQSIDQRYWLEHLQEDLLNPGFELLTLGELREKAFARPYFIRPVVDQKAFAGQVLSDSDLTPLYRGRKGEERRHDDSLLVATSPLVTNIDAEYRLVVLNHRVRLISQYRRQGRSCVIADASAHILEKAQQLAEGWMPADFIVMDIAELSNGDVKIIEFNSVHSSGLYAIPGEAFAGVVEEAVGARFLN